MFTKTVVTHFHPDVDAITAVWLVKTFLVGWQEASIAFVPAGQTLEGTRKDEDPNIIHVDTGMGRFDHHQSDENTCAAKRVYEYLKNERHLPHEQTIHRNDEALERIVALVNDIDHFRQIEWPEPVSDRYELGIEAIIDGWKLEGSIQDVEVVERGMKILDGVYRVMVNKVWAEKELEEKGKTFESAWGKGIAIETLNDDCLVLALKRGFVLAIRKDPHKGYVRIKSRPNTGVDLSSQYEALKKTDSQATWFLHASKQMVLNGSTKNPTMKATKLSLEEVVEIIKQ